MVRAGSAMRSTSILSMSASIGLYANVNGGSVAVTSECTSWPVGERHRSTCTAQPRHREQAQGHLSPVLRSQRVRRYLYAAHFAESHAWRAHSGRRPSSPGESCTQPLAAISAGRALLICSAGCEFGGAGTAIAVFGRIEVVKNPRTELPPAMMVSSSKGGQFQNHPHSRLALDTETYLQRAQPLHSSRQAALSRVPLLGRLRPGRSRAMGSSQNPRCPEAHETAEDGALVGAQKPGHHRERPPIVGVDWDALCDQGGSTVRG
eukprot:scaffold21478_cov67-Phaeocystis_antarctica.AAC.3